MGFHDGVADGGNAGEEGLGVSGVWAREGLDEDNVGSWGLVAGVEAEDVEGHFWGWTLGKEVVS